MHKPKDYDVAHFILDTIFQKLKKKTKTVFKQQNIKAMIKICCLENNRPMTSFSWSFSRKTRSFAYNRMRSYMPVIHNFMIPFAKVIQNVDLLS